MLENRIMIIVDAAKSTKHENWPFCALKGPFLLQVIFKGSGIYPFYSTLNFFLTMKPGYKTTKADREGRVPF